MYTDEINRQLAPMMEPDSIWQNGPTEAVDSICELLQTTDEGCTPVSKSESTG